MQIGDKLAQEIVAYSVKHSIRATVERYQGLSQHRVMELRRAANVFDSRRKQKSKAQRKEIAEYAARHNNDMARKKYQVSLRSVQLFRKEFGLQPVRTKKQPEAPQIKKKQAGLHPAIAMWVKPCK